MTLSRFKYIARKIYFDIYTSIAFYPGLMAILLLVVAWGCMYVDALALVSEDMEGFAFVFVREPDTARSLLSTLATGLISLMVFSFTMVMVVLNQTAANYSPRVLPGLVSQREHQLVLGLYLGTIAYTLAVLNNIESETFEVKVPRLSIVVNMVLALLCFGAFIFFIHKISTVIQVGNILKRIHKDTRNTLINELSSGNYNAQSVPVGDWVKVQAWESGYFFKVTVDSFKKMAEKCGLQVRILQQPGRYLLEGEDFLEVNQPVNEQVIHILMENFIFEDREIISSNYSYGFKQITEVALKALSPGINDSGTARQSIHYLTDLFQMIMRMQGQKVICQQDNTICLIYPPVPFEEIFYRSAGNIRNFSLQDVVVLSELIRMIKKLRERDTKGRFKQLFDAELIAISEGAGQALKIDYDIQYIRELIR
jgi:uncharacterized membrane protein